jgi:hypothetical protein
MKKRYRDLSGESGVTHYEVGDDWIDVWFKARTEPYRYRATRIGARHLRELARRAEAGKGLSTYISQHDEVRDGYER